MPDTVIEALACGLPVVAFNTGAVKELVQGESGKRDIFGANSWKLEQPDIGGLAEAAHDTERPWAFPKSDHADRLRASTWELEPMVEHT